jgi:hypothetical protein
LLSSLPGKSTDTREGAIRGLVGVGKEAVRKGLVEGGGAKVVAAEWESEGGESSMLVNSVLVIWFFYLVCFFAYSLSFFFVRMR